MFSCRAQLINLMKLTHLAQAVDYSEFRCLFLYGLTGPCVTYSLP